MVVYARSAPTMATERHLAEVRRSSLGLLGICLRTATLALIVGVCWAAIDVWLPTKSMWVPTLRWAMVLVVGLYVLVSLVRRFLGWANARLDITDQRVLIRYRARKSAWEIPLLAIVDVNHQSGPLQRLFGVGMLKVQTNFAPGPALMLDVRNVQQVREEILYLRNCAYQAYLDQYAAVTYQGGYQFGQQPHDLRAAS